METNDREKYLLRHILYEYWTSKTGSNVIDSTVDVSKFEHIEDKEVEQMLEICAKRVPKRDKGIYGSIIGYGI